MIIFTDGRTPWTSDQLVARPLPKHRTAQTQKKHIHHTSMPVSGLRTHDPSVRASKDSSCLRPLGYCDRLFLLIRPHIFLRTSFPDTCNPMFFPRGESPRFDIPVENR
jgi:hypothetical protein